MQQTYLFFDTETTSIHHARLVQLGAKLTDGKGESIQQLDVIVRPDQFVIPSAATKIHGISTQMAIEKGEAIQKVLAQFSEMLLQATTLVAHNMDFDLTVMVGELQRLHQISTIDALLALPQICTMTSTSDFVQAAWSDYYGEWKWPKLQELHYKLFETYFDNAHNALADVEATAKCFFELKNKHGFYSPKQLPLKILKA